MKILHYSLGFPPYRTGGLTKFCMDLMVRQMAAGDEVLLLWPGRMTLTKKRTQIRKYSRKDGILSCEIINPLPVALDEGIEDVRRYMMSGDKSVFIEFLQEVMPDVIHIHTLMGLHREFLEAAEKLGIRVVFTAHDYYGLCPKVTLFYNGKSCDSDVECSNCSTCNQTALSIKKIWLMQSPGYRILKDSMIVKWMRKAHRNAYFEQISEEQSPQKMDISTGKEKDYQELRKYYVSMYEMMNCIHFNSHLTRSIYMKYMAPEEECVIPITHSSIGDHRHKKTFSDDLRLTFLSPCNPAKGFFILKQALDKLWDMNKRNFVLNIYYPTKDVSPYMKLHERYDYDSLEKIFEETDILLAPSIWYETFGFTVLEALSYGVPVIISNHVGAKELLKECDYGMVVEASADDICDAIFLCNKERLTEMNSNIVQSFHVPLMSEMADRIKKEIYHEKEDTCLCINGANGRN